MSDIEDFKNQIEQGIRAKREQETIERERERRAERERLAEEAVARPAIERERRERIMAALAERGRTLRLHAMRRNCCDTQVFGKILNL